MKERADTIAIRTAAAGEAELVLELMRQGFAEYRGVLQPESSVFTETVMGVRGRLAAGGGLLALRGATPVGCIIAEDKGDRGYLGRLAVLPAARRLGVARRLIAEAEAFLRRRGLARAELNVRIALTGNVALFQAAGYRETARLAHPGWTEPTYLVMEKSLE